MFTIAEVKPECGGRDSRVTQERTGSMGAWAVDQGPGFDLSRPGSKIAQHRWQLGDNRAPAQQETQGQLCSPIVLTPTHSTPRRIAAPQAWKSSRRVLVPRLKHSCSGLAHPVTHAMPLNGVYIWAAVLAAHLSINTPLNSPDHNPA